MYVLSYRAKMIYFEMEINILILRKLKTSIFKAMTMQFNIKLHV